jgi:metal-responsive CopG/Arc/MetJ family transcriptional regulator
MSARPVQVSIDSELLARIDSDPETLEKGRSWFIRSAAELYLAAKRRQEIDQQLATAYRGKSDEMAFEIAELLERQEWPQE